MYYSPHTHLALARERHQDMLREAERHRLAASVARRGPSLVERIRALTVRQPGRRPVESPAL